LPAHGQDAPVGVDGDEAPVDGWSVDGEDAAGGDQANGDDLFPVGASLVAGDPVQRMTPSWPPPVQGEGLKKARPDGRAQVTQVT